MLGGIAIGGGQNELGARERCKVLCAFLAIGFGKLGEAVDAKHEGPSEPARGLQPVFDRRQAVERMDVAAVMALVSPRFYEDNGNVDTSDDYDYKGLETNLRANFEHTKAIQLMLRVDDVKVDADEAYAELYYQIRAHADYPSGPKWETGSDRTRLRFEKVDDRWLIVAGL